MLIIGANITGFLLAGLLSVTILFHVVSIPWLIFVAICFGVIVGLLGPANDAILKSLIVSRLFPKAQAIRETRESIVGLFGSTLSGALFKLGQSVPFLSAAVMYVLGLLAALQLPKRETQSASTQENDSSKPTPLSNQQSKHSVPVTHSAIRSFIHDLKEGCAWAWQKHGFRAAVFLGALVNVAFVFGITGAQILFMSQNVNAALIGFLDTGMALTSLIGALLANRLVDTVPSGIIIAGAMLFCTLCFMPMLFSSNYLVVFLSLACMGLFLPALNSCLLGFIYGKTPEHMQGRASAVFETCVGFLSAIAPSIAGLLLTAAHGFTVLIGIATLLAFAAFLIAVFSSLRKIPRPDNWENVEL